MAFDESQLIASAQKGNASAVEQLLEHYYDYIFSICRKVTGNIDDANEATQETLIKVVRNIPSFKSTAKEVADKVTPTSPSCPEHSTVSPTATT